MKKTVSWILVLCMLLALGSMVSLAENAANTLEDTQTLSVFCQEKANGADMHDMRIVIAADQSFLQSQDALKVTLSFRTADDTLYIVNYLRGKNSDYTLYEKITAGEDRYAAAEGDALFGNVVTGIPNGAWNTLEVTIENEDGDLLYNGKDEAKTIYMPGFVGKYFNDNGQKTYKGYRIDSSVDQVYDINTAPFEGLGGEYYSIVWDGYIKPDVSGLYTLETNADDGIRVYVDGVLVVRDNGPHFAEIHNGTVTLEAGKYHKVLIEYYNGALGGTAELYWYADGVEREIIPAENIFHTKEQLPGQFYSDLDELESGLVGDYYDVRDGKDGVRYVGSRVDDKIDVAYDINTAPYEGLTGEYYAIEWNGYLKTREAGSYIIKSSADDGVYVWVNGVLLIGDIGPHLSMDTAVALDLEADTCYEIRVAYYNGALGGSLSLFWQLQGVESEPSVIGAEYYYHLAK